MKPWPSLVEELPKGLSSLQVSRRLRKNYATTRYWLIKRGYHRKDGRCIPWSPARRKKTTVVNPIKVDWDLSDAVLAKQWGVTRQRMNQLRRARGNGHQ